MERANMGLCCAFATHIGHIRARVINAGYILSPSVQLGLVHTIKWIIDVRRPVKKQDTDTRAVPDLYLFVENVDWERSRNFTPDVYWSTCPQGTTRLTILELYKFGIDRSPSVQCEVKLFTVEEDEAFDLACQFYRTCGLNPSSENVAQILGYPVPHHMPLGAL
ncbi:hypothetical protein M422DRAFT_276144 [Sphaerobolus stellatus SS14]|uniref:Uncharacterized protein n=1 Tax=Sphaerobolus stellatus (strain SS14) TaxID=990650 RepID=A0A0C9T369_SPHS4|nr:hypothetical protein M422DRAFT_276144 [Sphaerobolus stellatus SS14]